MIDAPVYQPALEALGFQQIEDLEALWPKHRATPAQRKHLHQSEDGQTSACALGILFAEAGVATRGGFGIEGACVAIEQSLRPKYPNVTHSDFRQLEQGYEEVCLPYTGCGRCLPAQRSPLADTFFLLGHALRVRLFGGEGGPIIPPVPPEPAPEPERPPVPAVFYAAFEEHVMPTVTEALDPIQQALRALELDSVDQYLALWPKHGATPAGGSYVHQCSPCCLQACALGILFLEVGIPPADAIGLPSGGMKLRVVERYGITLNQLDALEGGFELGAGYADDQGFYELGCALSERTLVPAEVT